MTSHLEGCALSVAFPKYYANIQEHEVHCPILFKDFIKRPSLEYNKNLKSSLVDVKNATGAILNRYGDRIAQAILVTKHTALIPTHDTDGNENRIQFTNNAPVQFTILFDGAEANLDFKWVYFKEHLNITLPALTASGGIGYDLKFAFNDQEKLQVTPFESDEDFYMASSHSGGYSSPGDSGAALFDLGLAAIVSMIQGDGHGLPLKDIYQTIQSTTNSNQSTLFHTHLNQFYNQFINPQDLLLNTNTNPMQIGSVTPHTKSGLSREIVEKTGYFSTQFLNKHYARTITEAAEKAKTYNTGRVSIIRISSDTTLQAIVQQAIAKANPITFSSIWEFNNGAYSQTYTGSPLYIKYNGNQIHHVDFVGKNQ